MSHLVWLGGYFALIVVLAIVDSMRFRAKEEVVFGPVMWATSLAIAVQFGNWAGLAGVSL